MNIEHVKERIEKMPSLSSALGMEFISTPDKDTCMARMKVDDRNRQPFGFLHVRGRCEPSPRQDVRADDQGLPPEARDLRQSSQQALCRYADRG